MKSIRFIINCGVLMKSITMHGVEVFVDTDEAYIQINDIRESDIDKVLRELTKQYSGYEVVFCFHDMVAPADTLRGIGAELSDDCIKMCLLPQDCKAHENHLVTLLTEVDFDDFAVIHDTRNADMYWTSERIRNNRDIWRIFLLQTKQGISGYAMLMIELSDDSLGEIFCVEADDPAQCKAIFSAAANCAFECGKNEVVFMADRDDTDAQVAASAVGFRVAGYYQAYRVASIA